ncbi:MAG TPA: hypothetical protein VMU60_13285 [Syntrophobacteria bacterium]|nr:hypothetical protein [Syntrophobacteria bacterium]
MESPEQTFEAEPWRADYVQGWSRLPLGRRRHLARIAPPDSFQQVLADGSDQVMEAFLENPNITQAEVLILIDRCRSSFLLDAISRTSKWYSNHAIKRRLLVNPVLPHGIAFRILEYLPFVELQRVMNNINISREVRNKSRECFRRAFARLSDAETRALFLNTEGRVFRDLTVLSPKDKRVLMDLINRPQTPQPLILSLIRSTVATPEILQLIAERSFWASSPLIRRALLANGKTPPPVKASLRGRRGAGEGDGARSSSE